MSGARIGVIGLGTMGRNLALNIESRGFAVAVWNREADWTDTFIAEHAGRRFTGAPTLEALIAALEMPRTLLLMIPAGAPVDEMLGRLAPLLHRGDIVIDGGNSWFEDTARREAALEARGLHFVGCGVSGGAEGARTGPSLMPGGPPAAWARIRDVLEAIAAVSASGPCVTHVGPRGAGHFVKMVHNGIEYGDMQLIAEIWDMLRRGLGLSAAEAGEVFERWNRGPLESFLTELTARVARVVDEETGGPLVDVVLDRAAQKGTGRWTVRVALDLAVPIPTIAAAIDARVLSADRDTRLAVAEVLPGPPPAGFRGGRSLDDVLGQAHDAFYAARVATYAQGMALIRGASEAHGWGIDLAEIARIWTAGCIIRARLLEDVRAAFRAAPGLGTLLLDQGLAARVGHALPGLRRTVAAAADAGLPAPAHATALAYLDTLRSAHLPQNLVQAQRDAFGAHTYERRDRPGAVHSAWRPQPQP
jgi:6-phosphogluconate dehydrogenase